MPSQVAGFDITIYENHNEWKLDSACLIRELKQWAKKWAFQLEKCPTTDRLHFQVRLSLIKPKRLTEIMSQCTIKGNWSITSEATHKGCNFNYVMKADSRVEGPWIDTEYEDPPPLTRQLVAFQEREKYPWQVQIEQWCGELDDRSIKLIYDDIGNSGKSIMSEYLEYHRKAFEIPPLKDMEDIMQFCMSFKAQTVYLIDMPRAMKKDKLAGFYSGLESLKNGYVYDKRYAAKRRRFDRPQVIVFTNKMPEWSFMSKDRWQPWVMQKDHSLKAFEFGSDESSTPAGGLSGAAL